MSQLAFSGSSCRSRAVPGQVQRHRQPKGPWSNQRALAAERQRPPLRVISSGRPARTGVCRCQGTVKAASTLEAGLAQPRLSRACATKAGMVRTELGSALRVACNRGSARTRPTQEKSTGKIPMAPTETTAPEKRQMAIGAASSFVAGGLAGGLTRLCVAPLDAVKIRMQVRVTSYHNVAANWVGLPPASAARRYPRDRL